MFDKTIHAPELPQGITWLNTTQPLSISWLKVYLVLLDFWTYCCINCIHILPDLHWLEHKGACKIGDKSCNILPLFEPNDVVARGKKLYISDTNNHLMRLFNVKTMALEDVNTT